MELAAKIEIMAEELRAELERAFEVRGQTLELALRKSGRLLPARLRRQAAHLVEAERMQGNPKLLQRVDPLVIERSHAALMTYLAQIDPVKRRRDRLLDLAASLALVVLVTGGLLVTVLRWQGIV